MKTKKHGLPKFNLVHTEGHMVSIADIVKYEDGTLDQHEVIAMYQGLVDSGQAWTLQGHYGRAAKSLLESGHIKLRKVNLELSSEKT